MAIPYSEWLDLAQRLPEGRSKRVGHRCGEGAVLTIEHTKEGHRCWCYRCNEGGFKPHGRQALAAYINRWNAEAEKYDDRKIQLPDDLTLDALPWDAVSWLGAANITMALAEHYGISYSPRMGRVYLPVYGYRFGRVRLVYYQARAVHEGQTPKYLNPKAYKPELWFNSEHARPHTQPSNGRGREQSVELLPSKKRIAVVTEDILSAIRVGQVRRCTGVSLLGTSASTWHLAQLMQFKHVVIWLDPDAAGQRGTEKLKKALAVCGTSYSILSTDRDPKLYPHEELESILKTHLATQESGDE